MFHKFGLWVLKARRPCFRRWFETTPRPSRLWRGFFPRWAPYSRRRPHPRIWRRIGLGCPCQLDSGGCKSGRDQCNRLGKQGWEKVRRFLKTIKICTQQHSWNTHIPSRISWVRRNSNGKSPLRGEDNLGNGLRAKISFRGVDLLERYFFLFWSFIESTN